MARTPPMLGRSVYIRPRSSYLIEIALVSAKWEGDECGAKKY
jgi:hypothetical protein